MSKIVVESDADSGKTRTPLSKWGAASCMIASAAFVFWLVAVPAKEEYGLDAAAKGLIAVIVVAAMSLLGIVCAVVGLIRKGRRRLPLVGLILNVVNAACFVVYVIWPNTGALVGAAAHGDVSKVERCLTLGVDVNRPSQHGWHGENEGDTPLSAAAAWGTIAVVRVLLENGADVDKTVESGWTPLHKAALRGHTVIVELLLARGADIDAVNDNNQTPLHLAARQGHLYMVRLLVEHKADVSKRDQGGRTALELASVAHEEIVKLLSRHDEE